MGKPSQARHQRSRWGLITRQKWKEFSMSVFVLDRHKRPLMPCSHRRARLLLGSKRAVVHRLVPFTIRLKARTLEESQLQPVALKIDPGSQTTGTALARIEQTQQGEVHQAL